MDRFKEVDHYVGISENFGFCLKIGALSIIKCLFFVLNYRFTFDALLLLFEVIFLCTLYPWMWHLCVQMAAWIWPNGAEIWHSIVFIWTCSVVETIVSLPFTYYSTFFIEQKHGFNNETVPFFFRDRTLKLGVSLALSSPVVALLVWIIRNGGPHFPIYAWLAISLIIFVMMFVYPEFIAPLFDKYSPLPDSELKRKIEALADRVGFPLAKLYVVQNSKRSSHSNAYMYGLWKNKRIVLFDTLLSKEMNELLKKTEEEKQEKRKSESDGQQNEGAAGEEAHVDGGAEDDAAKSGGTESSSTEMPPPTGGGESAEAKGDKEAQNGQQQREEGGETTDGTEAAAAGTQPRRQIGMDDDEVVAVLGHELGHWKLGHALMMLVFSEVNMLIMLFIFSLFHQQESLFAAFGFPPAQQQPVLIGMLIIGQFVMAPYGELMSILINMISRRNEFQADHFSAQLGYAPRLRSGLKKLAKDNLQLPIDDVLYSWCNHSHPPIPERIEALKKFE